MTRSPLTRTSTISHLRSGTASPLPWKRATTFSRETHASFPLQESHPGLVAFARSFATSFFAGSLSAS
ncbi:MAG: hypothetical protein AUH82_00495 [Chloroflexi bacterium 13_1_40CM_4_65_13]|nr:MAG: hypothetical protein AUH82_00495 [Chloroflexi bacterium 13_1_40CM_4_65_13]